LDAGDMQARRVGGSLDQGVIENDISKRS